MVKRFILNYKWFTSKAEVWIKTIISKSITEDSQNTKQAIVVESVGDKYSGSIRFGKWSSWK